MAVTQMALHSTRYSYLVCFVSAVSSVLTLTVFFVSAIFEAFQKREKPAEIPKKKEPPPFTRLKKLQLGVTALIILLSIVHCVLLVRDTRTVTVADPELVCALFHTLTWTILLLGLLDAEKDAGVSFHRAWSVASVLELADFVLTTIARREKAVPIVAIDITLEGVRTVTILGLLGVSLLSNRAIFGGKQEATDEETQPLLGSEANGTAKKDDAKEDDKDDKESEEEEEKDEEVVDKKALEELKRRPLRQYIASYAIFLPFLQPGTAYQWSCIGVMAVCTLLQRLMNVVYPLSLGYLVSSLTDAQSIPWLQVLLYLGVTVLSTAGVVSMIQSLASARYTAAVKNSLDHFCYNHIMTLSADFHEAENSNRLGRIIDRGDVIAELFEKVFFQIVPQIADLFISMTVLAWLFGGYLCFIVAVTIVFFAWTSTKFVRQKTKLRRKWIDAMIAQWQQLFETHYNWMTVSHFNRVPYEQGVYKDKTTTMYDTGLVASTFDALTQFVRQIIIAIGFIAACLLAINQIIYGHGGIGNFVMLVTYWNQVMSPVTGLIMHINRTSEQLVDAERLLVILEQKPSVQNSPDAKDLDFHGGAVDFENVSFSYDGERIVSEDISFHISAGQTVAIVGETGGGKSTLLKLLFRFYDPKKGRILVDGQDLRDVNVESFRELIGFVPQDPALFERSVSDNVRYPDLTATDEEVEEACRGAVLHDKIMTFTKGYKQKVGKRGAKLSGGEQQRLAIARCILKKPKMLLLDEATSSVDSVTESKIHEGLKKLCAGRTTFIIAHRLSTILHADLILVMKNGRLVEAGPHRVLIKQDGAYKELWTAQLKLQEQNPDAVDEKGKTTESEEAAAAAAAAISSDEKVVVTETDNVNVNTPLIPGLETGEASGSSRTTSRATSQRGNSETNTNTNKSTASINESHEQSSTTSTLRQRPTQPTSTKSESEGGNENTKPTE